MSDTHVGISFEPCSWITIKLHSVVVQRGDTIPEDVEWWPLDTYRSHGSNECYSKYGSWSNRATGKWVIWHRVRPCRLTTGVEVTATCNYSLTGSYSVICQRGEHILEDVEWGPLGMYRSRGSNECNAKCGIGSIIGTRTLTWAVWRGDGAGE